MNGFFFVFNDNLYFIVFRRDVLAHLLKLQNFESMFLPNALRQFFAEISAPNDRDGFLAEVIDRFSDQFTTCNPNLGLSKGKFKKCFSLKYSTAISNF